MNRAIYALIAGLFAISSASALAAETMPQSKQAELDKVIAGGNANAPARGEAIKKSADAAKSTQLTLADASEHGKMLDQTIASGNPNAPVRGKAFADSMHATPRAA